ncbi:hypothetical protein CBR_g60016 [Chara braunii]|uniref:Uncharacterized protein n=1 Tax=Chara braunii TaxID=69332 RepID=A0A388K8I6_CHABU|nr:hypothetical protein CBR_g60016 [Chara braunii]|eukprot:GBG66365.1 hypothetical protein CBR_g60016 [Chara braunii]
MKFISRRSSSSSATSSMHFFYERMRVRRRAVNQPLNLLGSHSRVSSKARKGSKTIARRWLPRIISQLNSGWRRTKTISSSSGGRKSKNRNHDGGNDALGLRGMSPRITTDKTTYKRGRVNAFREWSEEEDENEEMSDDELVSKQYAFMKELKDDETSEGGSVGKDETESFEEARDNDQANEGHTFADTRATDSEEESGNNKDCEEPAFDMFNTRPQGKTNGGHTFADTRATYSEEESDNSEDGEEPTFDMFNKRPQGEAMREAKHTLTQEVRKSVFTATTVEDRPPYNLGKRGRNLRVYNKKVNFHVSTERVEEVLKGYCCKAECFQKFSAEHVYDMRQIFWVIKQPEHVNFLLAEMRAASYFSDEGKLEKLRVTFNNVKVCTRAWGGNVRVLDFTCCRRSKNFQGWSTNL